MLSDNSKSHWSVTVRKPCFFKWVFATQLTVMARQSTSLIDTFENDNEAF